MLALRDPRPRLDWSGPRPVRTRRAILELNPADRMQGKRPIGACSLGDGGIYRTAALRIKTRAPGWLRKLTQGLDGEQLKALDGALWRVQHRAQKLTPQEIIRRAREAIDHSGRSAEERATIHQELDQVLRDHLIEQDAQDGVFLLTPRRPSDPKPPEPRLVQVIPETVRAKPGSKIRKVYRDEKGLISHIVEEVVPEEVA